MAYGEFLMEKKYYDEAGLAFAKAEELELAQGSLPEKPQLETSFVYGMSSESVQGYYYQNGKDDGK